MLCSKRTFAKIEVSQSLRKRRPHRVLLYDYQTFNFAKVRFQLSSCEPAEVLLDCLLDLLTLGAGGLDVLS